jgi:hypothetical protein
MVSITGSIPAISSRAPISQASRERRRPRLWCTSAPILTLSIALVALRQRLHLEVHILEPRTRAPLARARPEPALLCNSSLRAARRFPLTTCCSVICSLRRSCVSPTSTPIQVLTVDSLARLVTSTLRRPRADLALPPSAAAWPRRQPATARVAHDSCADVFGSASHGGPRRRAPGLVDQLLVVEDAPQRWLVRWCTHARGARAGCGTDGPQDPAYVIL